MTHIMPLRPVDPIHMPVRVVVLIPAHNEATGIGDTLASIANQSYAPAGVLVIADNCTDDTEQIAREHGAEVFVTRDNTHKKAGGLNQALTWLLPQLTDDDLVLVMDADTTLAPRFVGIGAARLHADQDRAIGAVGGVFYGRDGEGLLGLLQRMEYARYAREIARKQARASVLTGTGTLFRVEALRRVQAARLAGQLPAGSGGVYDTLALTEDNELTLALKHLGYRCISPRGCRVVTDVMPTLGQLWHQRLRWQRGAFENLRHYGLTRITLPYILKQVLMGVGGVLIGLYMTAFFATWILVGAIEWQSPWLLVTAVFVAERVLTVRRLGPTAMFVAGPLVLDMLYDMFQQVVYFRALLDLLRRSEQRWIAT